MLSVLMLLLGASLGFLIGASAAGVVALLLPWPAALALQLGAGLLAAWWAVGVARRAIGRARAGSARRRGHRVLVAVLLPPALGTVAFVPLWLLSAESPRLLVAEAVLVAVVMTWWVLVPMGLVAGFFTWAWTSAPGTKPAIRRPGIRRRSDTD